jgi:hypothetical protein
VIWHVYDNPVGSRHDSRRKIVDLEAPHGLWDWDFGPDTVTTPNPISGLDSLDVDSTGNIGSATCIYGTFFNPIPDLDAFTNPSSDEYNQGTPVPQNIASHIAVRKIYLDFGDTTKMRADLIVNQVESDVGTATGENNGRRWILGTDSTTMYLVYVSKGYIYYTTTDQNKIWLPAIPIGQGSYPSLSLDTSGNPGVVWVEIGTCGISNSNLLFSRKSGGSWSNPETLLSISDNIIRPSFVIDTSDMGHVVYKEHFCQQNGNSAIHYGTFNINSPSLQDTVLDATSVSSGNASIDYTPYLNSIHVVWEKEGKIWYNWKDASGWHAPEDVFTEILVGKTKTPFIDAEERDTTVNVVCSYEFSPGQEFILHKKKPVGGTWGTFTVPSGLTSQFVAQQPFAIGRSWVFWSEIPSNGDSSEIIYAEWDSLTWQRKGNVSNTPEESNYPQAFLRGCVGCPQSECALEVVWTEGDSLPFHVKNRNLNLPDYCTPTGGGGPQSSKIDNNLPKVFALSNPYPSPFSENILIRYQLPKPAPMTLKIYDVTGRLVNTLANGMKEAGYYSIRWRGEDNLGKRSSSGIYFARMESDNFQASRKIILLR